MKKPGLKERLMQAGPLHLCLGRHGDVGREHQFVRFMGHNFRICPEKRLRIERWVAGCKKRTNELPEEKLVEKDAS